jgi:hypothetical protein
MLTQGFVNALGSKVGRVLEVGEAVKDFQRVRVDFDLASPLMASVGIRVKGRGWMEFMVTYESVPFFCLCCGRIGHQDRECPGEEIHGGEARYSIALRASPFKVQAGRRLTFQVTTPVSSSRRGLNFSGQQLDKVVSGSGSSSLSAGRRERASTRAGNQVHGVKKADVAGGSNAPVAASAVAEALTAGVQKMAVDGDALPPAGAGGNGRDERPGRDRVSGIDSYLGSSEGTMHEDLTSGTAGNTSYLYDRLQRAKAKVGGAGERKSPAKIPGATRDINKTGRYTPYKKTINPEALAKSIQTRQKGEVGLQTSGDIDAGHEG